MIAQSTDPSGTASRFPQPTPSAVDSAPAKGAGRSGKPGQGCLAADQAFRAGLAALIPALRGFARGLYGNRDAADALARGAMLQGWAKRRQLPPGTDVKTWLFKLAHCQFAAETRRNTAESRCAEPADILNSLQALPIEQRETLLLVGANNIPLGQAAKIMDCSLATARDRYVRGHQALAHILGAHAIASPPG